MQKVLKALEESPNRNAQFKTVIALILKGEEYYFEGVVSGVILKEKSGKGGFGYDPIFKPVGYKESFAEMSIAQKNEISSLQAHSPPIRVPTLDPARLNPTRPICNGRHPVSAFPVVAFGSQEVGGTVMTKLTPPWKHVGLRAIVTGHNHQGVV